MGNDNIIFEKNWEDDNLIELKITGVSKYVSAFQSCYVENNFLEDISVIISNYILNYHEECYLEFGKKEENYTPAFSMKLLPADNLGHVKIEVDMEIADNCIRAHRCCFYVNSELGQVEKLGKELSTLAYRKIGTMIMLNYDAVNKNTLIEAV